MMGRLDGKVIIITGGARGMGESHARMCLEEGAKVVITDLLEEKGQALANEFGGNVKFVKHDVSKAADWEQVITETEKQFGNVNVLINNAGISIGKMIADYSEEDYRKVTDTNQLSVFLGMKAVLSSMQKAGSGSIINIASTAALRPGAGAIAYCASKSAVRSMSKCAAAEWAKYNIRVNTVYPGVIKTPIHDNPDTAKLVESVLKTVPLRRLGQPKEVSSIVVYLASDESSFCTGADFVVDGGQAM